MSDIWWIVIVSGVAGIIGTGLGGIIGAFLGKGSNKIVSLLLSFAGGVMIAVVCFDLMQTALHPTQEFEIPFYVVVLGVLVGYLCVYLLNWVIDKKTVSEVSHSSKDHPKTHDDLDELIHSDHYDTHKQKKNGLFRAGLIMALVIALHNMPEGMVIGSTYVSNIETIIGGPGFLMAAVIGLHNIPEGMAISVPLISGGASRTKGILTSAASGIPTVIGAVLGFVIGNVGPYALSICLALASGAMLYVVFGELLPESILMWKSKLPALLCLIGLLVGFILVLI